MYQIDTMHDDDDNDDDELPLSKGLSYGAAIQSCTLLPENSSFILVSSTRLMPSLLIPFSISFLRNRKLLSVPFLFQCLEKIDVYGQCCSLQQLQQNWKKKVAPTWKMNDN